MGQYSTMADPAEIYRFRTAKALLNGYNELSRQTLYLALLEQLNDPAEDTYNVVWQGDDIIWPNFLNYYLRCVASSAVSGTLTLPGYHLVIIPVLHGPTQSDCRLRNCRIELC